MKASTTKDKRPSAQQRGYGRAWQTARREFLRTHPYCVMCRREDRRTPATVVDHIHPHKGDQAKFWNKDNWAALCKPHHDSAKALVERHGFYGSVGLDGVPLDPNHPFLRGQS